MDQDHNSKPNTKSDSSSDDNSNSSIPELKIELENSIVTTETEPSEEKNEPTSSNNKDKAKDLSQHLSVPSKESRVVRSSSLKIEKSSSKDSSSEKKIVRFADALGLDLVDVKVFVSDGSIPQVPPQAFCDLKAGWSNGNIPFSPQGKSKSDFCQEKYVLVPQFEQPGCDANFINRVKDQKVCLENVIVLGLQVNGLVRLSNLHYKKVIIVRYTTDDWKSEIELPANYVEGSSDTVTDKFTFTIHPRHMTPGNKLTFVLKYEVLDEVYWDNNNSNNYTLLCKERNNDSKHLNSKGQLLSQ